jgi:DNA-binding beta-propeller fold protein YncE
MKVERALQIALVLALMAGAFALGTRFGPERSPASVAMDQPLVARSRIMLPGVFGRIDHFGFDRKRGNLFIAALGNDTVEVVNNLRRIHSITGLQQPQGVLYVEEFDRLAVSDRSGKVRFYDGGSFKLLKTVDLGGSADNLRYEPEEKRVYVGHGAGDESAIVILDPSTMERVPQSFKVGSHPESFQFDRKKKRIFVNLPDQEAIGVIDRSTGKVDMWHIEGATTNHALAFDEEGRRLFSAAIQPGKLWVIDADSGRVVTTLRIVLGVDDIWFDTNRKRVLATGHAGYVSIIEQKSVDRYDLVASVPTGVGGGTSHYVRSRTFEGLFVGLPNTSPAGSEVVFLAVQE